MCTRFRVHHARLALPARSPAELPPSHFHPSQSVRRSRLAPSKAISTLAFPRFTVYPRSSDAPSSLPVAQAISTLHNPSTLVRRFRLAPSSGDPPKLFASYFHTFHSVCARAFFPSLRSFLPSFPLVPSFLPSFLPFLSSFLSFFLPSFPLSFLPSFLPRSSGSSVSRQSKLNENPSIGDAFGKNKTLVKCIALIRGVSYCGNFDWSRIIQWIGPRKSYMNPQIYQPDMGVDLAPCFFQDEEIRSTHGHLLILNILGMTMTAFPGPALCGPELRWCHRRLRSTAAQLERGMASAEGCYWEGVDEQKLTKGFLGSTTLICLIRVIVSLFSSDCTFYARELSFELLTGYAAAGSERNFLVTAWTQLVFWRHWNSWNSDDWK